MVDDILGFVINVSTLLEILREGCSSKRPPLKCVVSTLLEILPITPGGRSPAGRWSG